MADVASRDSGDRPSDDVARALAVSNEKARRIIEAFQRHFAKPFASKLQYLTLKQMIKTKNPYLYRSAGISTCSELVSRAFDDYVSSSVETYYGPFFEAVARIISGGVKPVGGGEIDLDIRYDGVAALYVIKSGPKGFNKSSRTRALQELRSAESKLSQDKLRVEKRIAFAYGRKRTTDREGVRFLASRQFWHEISGDERFYSKLLDACAALAPLYAADVHAPRMRLLAEAKKLVCVGEKINWNKVLHLISGS